MRPRQLWPLTIALLLVAVMLPGLQLIVRAATSVSAAVVEENWRGSYDILVTAPQFVDSVSPGENELGLSFVDPNYGNVSAVTLSNEDVAWVQELSDVEFAAPIGFIGAQARAVTFSSILIPWEVVEANPVATYRFTEISRTHDGFSERINDHKITTFVIDATGWDGNKEEIGSPQEHGIEVGFDRFGVNNPGRIASTPQGLLLYLEPVDAPVTIVSAVDPVLERRLLGERGEFLDTLAAAEAEFAAAGEVTATRYLDAEESGTGSELVRMIDSYPGGEKDAAPQ